MILISNDFWHIIKIYNFDPYNVLLAISKKNSLTVLQRHICKIKKVMYYLFLSYICVEFVIIYTNKDKLKKLYCDD